MRTTITIDDDVLALAKHLAQRDQKSVGEVISALVRQALAPSTKPPVRRNGVPLLPVRSTMPVTPELVNELLDELP